MCNQLCNQNISITLISLQWCIVYLFKISLPSVLVHSIFAVGIESIQQISSFTYGQQHRQIIEIDKFTVV